MLVWGCSVQLPEGHKGTYSYFESFHELIKIFITKGSEKNRNRAGLLWPIEEIHAIETLFFSIPHTARADVSVHVRHRSPGEHYDCCGADFRSARVA